MSLNLPHVGNPTQTLYLRHCRKMLITLLISLLPVYVAGLTLLPTLILLAPEGYEDHSGFHFASHPHSTLASRM